VSVTDADLEAELRREAENHGLFRLLGLELEAVGDGAATVRVPFDERVTNVANESMHGGIAATLIDTASGFALRSQLGAGARLSTTDLNVRYVRPATSDLRAEATVVRAGGSMGVTESTVTGTIPDGTEKTVATGGTTYRLFRGEGDA
jgi:uncharacterized protein (TIGR00369 family)